MRWPRKILRPFLWLLLSRDELPMAVCYVALVLLAIRWGYEFGYVERSQLLPPSLSLW